MPVRHRGNELSEPKFGWMLYQERRLAAAFGLPTALVYGVQALLIDVASFGISIE